MIVFVTAANTVDNSHALRRAREFSLFVSQKDLAAGGPGSIVETLKLEAGKHIGVSAVAELFHGGRVQEIVSGCYDYTTSLYLYLFILHFVINGLGLAGINTGHTF